MNEFTAQKLNQYLTNEKEVYDLLESKEIGFFLPSMKCSALTIDILLKIVNEQVYCPLKKYIKKIESKKLEGLSKIVLYQQIKAITNDEMGYKFFDLPQK